ncbi:LmeA family phospholipid-binding protein [Blastococcus sp. SYSU D01042]
MRALLVVLVLLLGLLVVGDRVAVAVVEGRVADELAAQEEVTGEPEVDVRGFPFLTQAVGGRYDDIRISLTATQPGQADAVPVDVALRGVRLALSDALSGSVTELPVDRIDGTATISYDVLAAQLGGDAVVAPEGEGLRITRTVEVLGQTFPVSAAGTVVLEGDQLVVDVDRASGAGIELPGSLVDRVSDLLDLRYTVPELPFGLQLTGVSPADDGVLVRVEATDAVLTTE